MVRARIQARLIGDLRRGDPILIKGDPAADDAWLALPLETASEASLAEWSALLGAAVPRALLISGERAALLATGAMPSPEIRQSGSILLPIAENGTGIQAIIEALQTLAGLTQKPRPFGHHIGLSAPAVLDTVITLLKRGFLIPAALVWQVPVERIAELEAMAVLTTEAISGDALANQPVVVRQTASADVPLKLAENCRISVYRTIGDGRDHVAIEVTGKQPATEIPLVRVHAECFTGDLLGSLRCDCRPQLEAALRQIEAEGEESWAEKMVNSFAKPHAALSPGNLQYHDQKEEEHAQVSPLHDFEESVKGFVDFFVLFAFGAVNAGVDVGETGGFSFVVLLGLLIGKTLGMTCGSLVASYLGFDRPEGMQLRHLVLAHKICLDIQKMK